MRPVLAVLRQKSFWLPSGGGFAEFPDDFQHLSSDWLLSDISQRTASITARYQPPEQPVTANAAGCFCRNSQQHIVRKIFTVEKERGGAPDGAPSSVALPRSVPTLNQMG
jgi:ABC-type transporter Mla subunit MlaD